MKGALQPFEQSVDRASRWLYRGVWAVLVRWFRVPADPPTLPVRPGEQAISFRPAEGFLKYLKFYFWLVLSIIDGAIVFTWLAFSIAIPLVGAITLLPMLFIVIVPDILAYIGIHLRYDTTWYVLTRRSLRVRRGIWIIRETTITFENVQNLTVTQGPLERYFGIGNVVVETAGGGEAQKGPHGSSGTGHTGLIEGISNAAEVRDMILQYVRASNTAGLGDDREPANQKRPEAVGVTWTPAHLALLREIRDASRALA